MRTHHHLVVHLVVIVLAAAALVLGACGGDSGSSRSTVADTIARSTTTLPTTATSGAGRGGQGTLAVRLEEVEGFFIEGFEVGLRFETESGEIIAATLWSDYVAANGDGSIESYYDSVLEQPVPAGEVIVLATVSIGAGPPPVTPDVEGDLDCRLEVDVPPGARTEVEVAFASENCLRQV